MNTRQLQYVLAVAEVRSFTKAADKLFISQPALSHFISKLEQELGHELFDRSITPLRLTPAGEAYVETARKILDLETQIEKRFQDMGDEQYGRLVIGATPHHGYNIFPEAVKRFYKKYPKFALVIREHTMQDLMMLMDAGQLDMCITILPVDEERYNCADIKYEGVLFAVAKHHPINNEIFVPGDYAHDTYPTVDLKKLQSIPFVILSEGYYTRSLIYELCRQAGFCPKIAVECNSAEMCRALVSEGIGVTFLPTSMLEFANNRIGLSLYTIVQRHRMNKLVAIYRKNHYVSKATLDFIEILQEKQ